MKKKKKKKKKNRVRANFTSKVRNDSVWELEVGSWELES